MPKPPLFSSVAEVLKSLITRHGLEGPMAEHRLRQDWTAIVGSSIAEHAQPEQLRFHKLYLSVDSSAWMHELSFLKPVLIQKVNSALQQIGGGFNVKEIVLRLGTSPPAPPAPPRKKAPGSS